MHLYDEIRPSSLDDFVGQSHLIGEGKILRKLIQSGGLTTVNKTL